MQRENVNNVPHFVKPVQVANRLTALSVSLTEQLLLAIVPQDIMKSEKVYALTVITLVSSALAKAQIDAKHVDRTENSISGTVNVNQDIMNNFKLYAGYVPLNVCNVCQKHPVPFARKTEYLNPIATVRKGFMMTGQEIARNVIINVKYAHRQAQIVFRVLIKEQEHQSVHVQMVILIIKEFLAKNAMTNAFCAQDRPTLSVNNVLKGIFSNYRTIDAYVLQHLQKSVIINANVQMVTYWTVKAINAQKNKIQSSYARKIAKFVIPR